MSLRKSEDFISDIKRQFEWYATNADWGLAERDLEAIESTCQLIGQHPLLGPNAALTHRRLREWRFIRVFRPFQKHLIFYEVNGADVEFRRAMHGHRNLSTRLLELPS